MRHGSISFLFLLALVFNQPAAGFAAAAGGEPAATMQNTTTEPDPAQARWLSCVAHLRNDAVAEGINPAAVNRVLDRVTHLPRVISADRKQPEFTETFTDYYRARVTEARVARGRELLASHGRLLDRIRQVTGVPAHYLVALWGLETNFGSYFGKLPLPSALATLACDSRRPGLFTRELFALIRIIDAGDMRYDDLIGSWAGAIGHLQFMPSTFLAHAVDGNADGRKDLVGSIEDALLSGGVYLASAGWQPGFRWGREVLLPGDFDYAVAGRDNWRPLTEWRTMGITDVSGAPIGTADIEAALLLPSGHAGPVFLVYPNFNVIMKWNRSQSYALSVGRLADRIAGAGHLHTPLLDDKLSTRALQSLQTQLHTLGFDTGTPDGVLGPATRKAIREFQQQHGLPADGYPDATVVSRVAAAAQTEP